MKYVYWLRAGAIAGRCGPDLKPWSLEAIRGNGFSAILSVNDGEAVHATRIKDLQMEYANIPLSANIPPRAGDREQCLNNLPEAMDFIGRNLGRGPVLVHCRSGKDRTGMTLAAYLITYEGYAARTAMDEVIGINPIAFSAEGWLDFGQEVLTEFGRHRSLRPGK